MNISQMIGELEFYRARFGDVDVVHRASPGRAEPLSFLMAFKCGKYPALNEYTINPEESKRATGGDFIRVMVLS